MPLNATDPSRRVIAGNLAREGLRTLVVACRPLSEAQYAAFAADLAKARLAKTARHAAVRAAVAIIANWARRDSRSASVSASRCGVSAASAISIAAPALTRYSPLRVW